MSAVHSQRGVGTPALRRTGPGPFGSAQLIALGRSRDASQLLRPLPWHLPEPGSVSMLVERDGKRLGGGASGRNPISGLPDQGGWVVGGDQRTLVAASP